MIDFLPACFIIGLGLVSEIAATHPDAFIYAGVRDPSKPSGLDGLKEKYPSRISVIKYAAGDEESNKSVAKDIEAGHGRVDTVIANAGTCLFSLESPVTYIFVSAGISEFAGTALETPTSSFERQFAVCPCPVISSSRYLPAHCLG